MSDFALKSRMTVLENELRILRETQAIESLRYRYWFAILDKDVAALTACFDKDAHLEYGFGIELDGVKAINDFFTPLLSSDELLHQVPRGTGREITIVSDVRATGRWLVEVVTTSKGESNATRVGVQYFEKYCKTDQGWRIIYMKNDYLGFEDVALKNSPA